MTGFPNIVSENESGFMDISAGEKERPAEKVWEGFRYVYERLWEECIQGKAGLLKFKFKLEKGLFFPYYHSVCLIILNILLTETAKLRFCPSSIDIVATPTTSPFKFIIGPPLEPCEMGAVICKTFIRPL